MKMLSIVSPIQLLLAKMPQPAGGTPALGVVGATIVTLFDVAVPVIQQNTPPPPSLSAEWFRTMTAWVVVLLIASKSATKARTTTNPDILSSFSHRRWLAQALSM